MAEQPEQQPQKRNEIEVDDAVADRVWDSMGPEYIAGFRAAQQGKPLPAAASEDFHRGYAEQRRAAYRALHGLDEEEEEDRGTPA